MENTWAKLKEPISITLHEKVLVQFHKGDVVLITNEDNKENVWVYPSAFSTLKLGIYVSMPKRILEEI